MAAAKRGAAGRRASAPAGPEEAIALAWRTNQRINLRLIDAIDDQGMRSTLSARGGRDVCRQFAHLHNVRIWHLEARAKALAKGARKFETKEEPSRRELIAALDDSAARIEAFLRKVSAGGPGAPAFKRGVIQVLSYFVAHESHHRGNILLTLKQCGHPVPQEIRYGIWDWDRI